MSWVIIEIDSSGLTGVDVVKVIGPYTYENLAEMERRARYLDRYLDSKAARSKSFVCEVKSE